MQEFKSVLKFRSIPERYLMFSYFRSHLIERPPHYRTVQPWKGSVDWDMTVMRGLALLASSFFILKGRTVMVVSILTPRSSFKASANLAVSQRETANHAISHVSRVGVSQNFDAIYSY